jgi:oligosaccharide repeat unit polymerase
MALIFLTLFGLYYLLVQRRGRAGSNVLSKILVYLYLALGLSAVFIEFTGISRGIYPPNYLSAAFLAVCILIVISGFRGFRSEYIPQVIANVRGQRIIENVLIVIQLAATLFFLPIAASNFSSDIAAGRSDLTSVTDLLSVYGLLNTFASAACQLFNVALVFAFIRLAQPDHPGKWPRVGLLLLSSFSYVIYILAYIGRDGVIYWVMTTLALFVVFSPHLSRRIRFYSVTAIQVIIALMMIPFLIITFARFGNTEFAYAGLFEYFGSQIQNFSDYSTIVRPETNGLQSFPMFYGWVCEPFGSRCENWEDIRTSVFAVYLDQGKEPWLFGTFVSDWVADFGYTGAAILCVGFAGICRALLAVPRNAMMSASRLLLILFFFLVPYWGVFYFRFGISNGYIIVNLAFALFVWMLERTLAVQRVAAPR